MALEFPRTDASIADLLAGSKEGWVPNHEGQQIRGELDPVWLVAHCRRIGAQWHRIYRPGRGWLAVNREVLLPVLWLALAERGWTIDRQDAIDAWELACITPARTEEGNDPSELAALAAALKRMDAALDRCLLLNLRHHPPPPTQAGLIRRADEHTHLN